MPAHYAHYRFGKQVLSTMAPEQRQCVQRFRRMYDMGLNGPDIFFYFNPYWKTATGDLGETFHRQSGREFFAVAAKAATSEAALAYLYGLLAHYCLDSVCHPYIRQLVDIEEAKHTPLESAFERHLLLLDKKPSPQTYDMSKHWKLTRGECMTVAAFYPGTTGAKISQSVKSMAFSVKFLQHPNRTFRKKLLQKFKPSLCDHMIPEEDNEDIALYLQGLNSRFDRAAKRYPRLLEQLTVSLRTGRELGEDFAPDFG